MHTRRPTQLTAASTDKFLPIPPGIMAGKSGTWPEGKEMGLDT